MIIGTDHPPLSCVASSLRPFDLGVEHLCCLTSLLLNTHSDTIKLSKQVPMDFQMENTKRQASYKFYCMQSCIVCFNYPLADHSLEVHLYFVPYLLNKNGNYKHQGKGVARDVKPVEKLR